MTVKTYRKKPVEVHALQYTGNNIRDIITFTGGLAKIVNGNLEISTLEGTMVASIGDYIIMGINGEFYPCKEDIFNKTYEEVE